MGTKKIKLFTLVLLTHLFSSCASLPETVKPIVNFEADKYLGRWYEIARLDHVFERGLKNVIANYSKRKDGGIKVVNRGFSVKKNKWKEAVGKAYFVTNKNIGHLKVSFFGPFYGDYVIFDLDKENYQYAFVAGPNLKYLWLLSRTPTVDKKLIDKFKVDAETLGFDTEKLIFVTQN